jgi:hypothetical protein
VKKEMNKGNESMGGEERGLRELRVNNIIFFPTIFVEFFNIYLCSLIIYQV